MQISRCLILILLCFVCVTTKKIKDDDFAEFEDFDQDEFETGTCKTLHLKISSHFYIIETPPTTQPSPSSGNKPESIKTEDRYEPEVTKTDDDEAVVIDDDDDSMFDDEEFETVILRF